jgi:hypothetical protein
MKVSSALNLICAPTWHNKTPEIRREILWKCFTPKPAILKREYNIAVVCHDLAEAALVADLLGPEGQKTEGKCMADEKAFSPKHLPPYILA